MKIIGVDFTSAPGRDKKIVVAECRYARKELSVVKLTGFADWPAYELWLGSNDEWVGGFDFPFGLPRRFIDRQGWSGTWPKMIASCVAGGKEAFVEAGMRAFMSAGSVADKHRRTDRVAGSHSPLKTKTNPPVGRMFYEGAWRLLTHRIRVPRMNETASSKIAVEAYPGYFARAIGIHHYKNDKLASAGRNREARRDILRALHSGHHPLDLKVRMRDSLRDIILADASGDALDSILCAVTAAWAEKQPRFGIPADVDVCEGWIVGAREP